MKKFTFFITLLCFSALGTGQLLAADRSGFDDVTRLLDQTTEREAFVFAPKTWEKAYKAYQKAEQDLAKGKKQKDLDKHVAETREYLENALKATDVCRLSLEQYLPPRDKAIQAGAPQLVKELYLKAEEKFKKATAKVESGDVKGGLKEAGKSTALFEEAELEAIRVYLLGRADQKMAKAVADEAEKYAPSTLDKARPARLKANLIIKRDRYERDESIRLAQLAEYEARHASNIAMSVRSLNRNDQAWEKLMLGYEIQMGRVGEAMGMTYLPFDDGSTTAADILINNYEMVAGDLTETSKYLQVVVKRFGQEAPADDVEQLAATTDALVAALIREKGALSAQVADEQSKMAELAAQNEEMSGQLGVRLERERKFRQAKMLISPSEGEVLFNAANDIVLRLGGLSFDSGRAELKDEHIVLLDKMEQIILMFPDTKLVIEGHTDALGDANSNQKLSEKRAYAVMQHIRQKLMISADRIQAIGYGADRPIGSNRTSEGRAKNRRIDIIVMQ